MQSRRTATNLARRYVAGDDVSAAVEIATALKQEGISCSAFYLGEYVNRPDLVEKNMAAKQAVIGALAAAGLDVHVSVDPTQVGCAIDWDEGAANVAALAEFLTQQTADKPGRHCLMLDMEDFSVNARTLSLYDELTTSGNGMAITLQAYLRKTGDDMARLIEQGAMVRLVKGAFAAIDAVAYKSHDVIKNRYRLLIDQMLAPRARECGFYPIFATHDHRLHDYAVHKARARGWKPGEYEIEMLYGARMDVARSLARRGETIRLYLPFGTDWWPYAIRRIGENPANAALLLAGLIGR